MSAVFSLHDSYLIILHFISQASAMQLLQELVILCGVNPLSEWLSQFKSDTEDTVTNRLNSAKGGGREGENNLLYLFLLLPNTRHHWHDDKTHSTSALRWDEKAMSLTVNYPKHLTPILNYVKPDQIRHFFFLFQRHISNILCFDPSWFTDIYELDSKAAPLSEVELQVEVAACVLGELAGELCVLDSSELRSYCTAQLCILLRLLAGMHIFNHCYAMCRVVTWFFFIPVQCDDKGYGWK